MTIRRLLLFVIAVFLVVGLSVAQGPKKDVGKNVPLPAGSDQKSQPPAKGEDVPQVPSLSIDVDLINFDVVVTDQSGNPISGLEKKHFRVFDDDVEQTVTNFAPAEAPLTVVVLAEFTPTGERHADGSEESRADHEPLLHVVVSPRPAEDSHRARRATTHEKSAAGRADGPDARERGHPRLEVAEQREHLRPLVPRLTGRDRHHHQAITVETHILGFEIAERAYEQPRTDQENHRHTDLEDQ